MEECEALCSRIGIMTAGRFQCLGSQQHLKSKYGGGYTLELRVQREEEELVVSRMEKLFPSALLLSSHAGKFKYELPMESISLSSVFETMEQNKVRPFLWPPGGGEWEKRGRGGREGGEVGALATILLIT